MPEPQHGEAVTMPSPQHDALRALFGRLSGAAQITLRDAQNNPMPVHLSDDLADVLAREPEPYVDSVVGDRVAFVAQHAEGVGEDDWKTLSAKPSVVLAKDVDGVRNEMRYFVFALPQRRQTVEALANGMGVSLDEPVPLDGSNGWALVHAGPTVHTPNGLSSLRTDGGGLGRHMDAVIRTPFDFDDPCLSEKVWMASAGKALSTHWEPKQISRRTALERFCRHRPAAQKDGKCDVLGKLPEGRRLKDLMESMFLVGLDFDAHVDGDVLSAAIAETGLMAVMASTFSHNTTTTTETWKSLSNWMVQIGMVEKRDDAEVTIDVVRARMASAPKSLAPEIVESMSIEITGQGDDREVVITHAPIQKWRVIFFLDKPFVIADHARPDMRGVDIWARVPRALAQRLGGLHLDGACIDVSRAWYRPSHPAGRDDYRIDLFGGDLVSLDELLAEGTALLDAPPAEPLAAIPGVAADAPVMKALAAYGDGSSFRRAAEITGPFGRRWAAREAAGFDIVSLLEKKLPKGDSRLRGKRDRKLTIQCPFADDHSKRDKADSTGCFATNAGDGRGEGFTIYCSHGSCNSLKRDRLTYLNKMIHDEWFTEADVAEFQQLLHDDDDDDLSIESLSQKLAALDLKPQAGVKRAGAVAVTVDRAKVDDFGPDARTFSGKNAADDAIAAMGKFVSKVTQGNRTRLAIQTRDGLVFNSKADAMLRFESFRAFIDQEDKNGEPKPPKAVPALKLLLESPDVRIYDGIDCDPTDTLPAHMLNTWGGIEVAPAPGDCSLLLRHIRESMCAGNEEHAKVLIQFLAHMFQKPKEKPGFAPVVIGPKGAGKSTVADIIRQAIGRKHSVKISQSKHLSGSFNAHLSGKLFVQAEEVTFGGDRKGEGPLKDAITSRTMLTEPKGMDAYAESNFSRFFLITNPGHAVPAGDGERRWFVLQARDLFAGLPQDHPERGAYFDAIYDEAANGGVAAFVQYLVNYDISDFRPYGAPRTEGLVDQIIQSLSDEDRWVWGLLEFGAFDDKDGDAVGAEHWELDTPLLIPTGDVMKSFSSHVRRFGGSSGGAGASRKALEAHGEVVKRRTRDGNSRVWCYELAPRRVWREHFTERYGITFADE